MNVASTFMATAKEDFITAAAVRAGINIKRRLISTNTATMMERSHGLMRNCVVAPTGAGEVPSGTDVVPAGTEGMPAGATTGTSVPVMGLESTMSNRHGVISRYRTGNKYEC
jgi:hypothetical protein